ncbi:SDR family oxidoreductase [Arthrobacter sp. 4R501]|uniref:SDR family oxidoreductase n=1 Tax=Arthrobacter sp. 4R501 TaxID=2058886 RepID=UPI0028006D32|nr:SDR family oxidoreductase [Arthrobacter sp. 4R501]
MLHRTRPRTCPRRARQRPHAVVTARDVTTVEDIAATYPDTALALPLDVTKTAEIGPVVEQSRARFGGIDVLVNTPATVTVRG